MGTPVAHGGEAAELRKAAKAERETIGISFATSRTALSRKVLWDKASGTDPLAALLLPGINSNIASTRASCRI